MPRPREKLESLVGARPLEMNMRVWVNMMAMVIAGWSGFYVMLVELLGGRLVSPYFGSSIYVWGSVIFVFMLALSIGYLLGGLLSRRSPSVSKLSLILTLAALFALPIVLFGEAFLERVFESVEDPRYGSLIACAGLYFVPIVLSGMVSPYAIRLIIKDTESSGLSAGTLYFISTIGSSAGTLLTSFYFVLWFEVNQILIGAVLVSLAVAIAGVLVDVAGRRRSSEAA